LLHQQGLDTSTPSGRAVFQMLGMFAEFESSMIREGFMAGLSRAKVDGMQLGRRRLENSALPSQRSSRRAPRGLAFAPIARDPGAGVGTVVRATWEVTKMRHGEKHVRRGKLERPPRSKIWAIYRSGGGRFSGLDVAVQMRGREPPARESLCGLFRYGVIYAGKGNLKSGTDLDF
jgi:hypothetical protein